MTEGEGSETLSAPAVLLDLLDKREGNWQLEFKSSVLALGDNHVSRDLLGVCFVARLERALNAVLPQFWMCFEGKHPNKVCSFTVSVSLVDGHPICDKKRLSDAQNVHNAVKKLAAFYRSNVEVIAVVEAALMLPGSFSHVAFFYW